MEQTKELLKKYLLLTAKTYGSPNTICNGVNKVTRSIATGHCITPPTKQIHNHQQQNCILKKQSVWNRLKCNISALYVHFMAVHSTFKYHNMKAITLCCHCLQCAMRLLGLDASLLQDYHNASGQRETMWSKHFCF